MKRFMVYRLSFSGKPFFVGVSNKTLVQVHLSWTSPTARKSKTLLYIQQEQVNGRGLELDAVQTDMEWDDAMALKHKKQVEYGLIPEPTRSLENRERISKGMSAYWERRRNQ